MLAIFDVSAGPQSKNCVRIFPGLLFATRRKLHQFAFGPKIQYEVAAERSEAASSNLPFSKVSPRQELNLHLGLRRPLFCPLNYEGEE